MPSSILVIQNMYPPHHQGGYELACRDVVERWRAAGHTVNVLAGTMRVPGVDDPPGERDEGVWRDLPIAYANGDLWRPPYRHLLRRERQSQSVLADAIRKTKPDVISIWHHAALSTGLLKTLAASGIPLAYVLCDDWLTYAPEIDPWMRFFEHRPRLGRFVERVTGVPATLPDVGTTGVFLFVSELTRRRAEELSPWTYPVSSVCYLGIDLEAFPILDPAPKPWRGRLLQADRFDPRKGLETSLRALTLLDPSTTLAFFGKGDPTYRERILALAAEWGVADRVTAGALPRPELAARYADADAVLFPTEWDEPFGLTPLEAMACGTPVITTAAGGSSEFLVDEVNCLRVPLKNPEAVAAAVRRLEGDEQLRLRLTEAGRHTAADLTVDRFAEGLLEWHLAAADRFAHGFPAHRPPPSIS